MDSLIETVFILTLCAGIFVLIFLGYGLVYCVGFAIARWRRIGSSTTED